MRVSVYLIVNVPSSHTDLKVNNFMVFHIDFSGSLKVINFSYK